MWAFDARGLWLPAVLEDDVIVVVDGAVGHVVLHRNDQVPTSEAASPQATVPTGVAARFAVEDPDECERQAVAGLPVLWRRKTRRGALCRPR